ncbi:Uncharacterized protein Adt_35304 [Abeliophyllum distichum]|uniref:Uncharacterized protein n=1 Tax=Abeliophyllum distichum TaxID=126358 RepID=A0ABD1QEI8_9LAMI
MNTFVRNPTHHFSRRSDLWDEEKSRECDNGWKMFSRRTIRMNKNHIMTSFSVRRERARKRHIFLQTYKLSSLHSRDKFRTRKLKKFAVKVKSVVVSLLSFMRGGALESCNSRSAVCASSPTRVIKCC